jgi:hypothetical protein
MKYLKLLLFMIMGCLGASGLAQPLKWQDRRFIVDECGIRYNGEQLPLGKDTMEWVRVLGPPDRRLPQRYWLMNRKDIGYMVWDSHGLALEFDEVGDTLWVCSALFFFMGLGSEEGQSLSLGTRFINHGYNYRPLSKEEDAYMRSDSTEAIGEEALFHADLRSFPYPVVPVRSQVRLDGVILNPYIRISELNRLRISLGFPLFRYMPTRAFFNDSEEEIWKNPRGYFYDSTFAGLYTLKPLRTCQDLAYSWTLSYSNFKRLVHLRVSTFRPWENAAMHEDQLQNDIEEDKNERKVKDGKQPDFNNFYKRQESLTKRQMKKLVKNILNAQRNHQD